MNSKILEYREYFKGDILAEDPETIVYGDKRYGWENGESTFCIYKDKETKGIEWVSIEYEYGRFEGIKSSVSGLDKEMGLLYKGDIEDWLIKTIHDRHNKNGDVVNMDIIKSFLELHITKIKRNSESKMFHEVIGKTLAYLGRHLTFYQRGGRETFECAGRLFNAEGTHILSIWNSNDVMVKYHNIIFSYLKVLGIDPRLVKYQTDGVNHDVFFSYDDMFKKKKVEEPKSSSDTYKKREAEWKAKQHALAGMLPKGWRL
jgi:hypothetical protein